MAWTHLIIFVLYHLPSISSDYNQTKEMVSGKCNSEVIEKYHRNRILKHFRYLTCLALSTNVTCPGVIVQEDLVITRNCPAKISRVCCRGPDELERNDQCDEAVHQFQEGPNVFVRMNGKRSVMELVDRSDPTSADDCATFSAEGEPRPANVTRDVLAGYVITCNCDASNCKEGDAVVCDNYIAGIVVLQSDRMVTKLAVVRLRTFKTVEGRTVPSNEVGVEEVADIKLINGCVVVFFKSVAIVILTVSILVLHAHKIF